jgi:dTDP-4-amino-4,6-dideoxygalactose transaminase
VSTPIEAQIPLVDLQAQFQSVRGEVLRAIEAALDSMELFLGPQTRAFEQEFAAYCGARYAVGVGNGTDALHLALRAAGVGPGDEVVTVSHTFFATAEAIELVGARPVFVDIDPRTATMAVDQLAAAITPATRAIIPVHLYGRVADMAPIMKLARNLGLRVIEDASQAHGAEYRGRRAGSIGDLGCFSFYYSKNLGAYGEAGAVVTSDPELARQVALIRDHGSSMRYQHERLGMNARIDEIQSAILRIKLGHLDTWNSVRRAHARRYDELLADADVVRPELPSDDSHVFHLYVIRTARRAELKARLAEAGIATGIHYPVPVHLQPPYRAAGHKVGELPGTERAADQVLSLPMYPELTEEQLRYVASSVTSAANAR